MTLAAETAIREDGDHIDAADFSRLSMLIGREAGIKLPPSKRLMVEGRLRKRMRALGLPGLDAYCRYLFDRGGLEDELVFLIDVVTTNKTDFYREPEHFEFLRRRAVPELIAARAGHAPPLLKIWSAASSTGAEAYTAAMVLADLAAERGDFRFAVLGTDISTAVLETAERAIYSEETIRPVPAGVQSRYVMRPRAKASRAGVRIVPELRRLVRFDRLNLMDSAYPYDRDVDVIFLRNVLIYFDKADQAAVIARLVSHLRPGGYLMLGHSETLVGSADAVTQVAPATFRKR